MKRNNKIIILGIVLATLFLFLIPYSLDFIAPSMFIFLFVFIYYELTLSPEEKYRREENRRKRRKEKEHLERIRREAIVRGEGTILGQENARRNIKHSNEFTSTGFDRSFFMGGLRKRKRR